MRSRASRAGQPAGSRRRDRPLARPQTATADVQARGHFHAPRTKSPDKAVALDGTVVALEPIAQA